MGDGNIANLPRWQRCLMKKVAMGSAWPIGPRQQPQTFSRLVPNESTFLEDCIFELAWEPPCLYLIKPTPDTPLCVNGTPVRQTTFVVLQNSEISLCREAGCSEPVIAFRILRDAAAIQAIQPQELVECPIRTVAQSQPQQQPQGDAGF